MTHLDGRTNKSSVRNKSSQKHVWFISSLPQTKNKKKLYPYYFPESWKSEIKKIDRKPSGKTENSLSVSINLTNYNFSYLLKKKNPN